MRFQFRSTWMVLVCAAVSWGGRGAEPPAVPVGFDAYRQWEKWPFQRIGVRAYMRSTYDRRGGNEAADASHFLYQLADDNNVTLDVEGRGILYFARYNHWHGSPWRYVVDGREQIVKETSTADPNNPVQGSVFIPEEVFPKPLAWTWSTTKGADLSWVPIAFERTFRMGYSRTHYGTGYYIYHLFSDGIETTSPITAWDGRTAPPRDVLELINRAGTDLSPASAIEKRGRIAELPAGEERLVLQVTEGPAMIRKLSFSVPRDQALAFGRARVRITWDDRSHPSIEAPLSLLFGAGTLYNRDDREYLVRGFPMFIRYTGDRVELACFYPMPFFKSARIELTAPDAAALKDVQWVVRHETLSAPPSHVGYFHATYRDHGEPERGKDLVLLDTREVEGGGDWSGSFVGTSWIFSDRAVLTTLEGDPRFFFDDSQTPQAYGTGTEEWGGGGDYWGGLNMTLPFAGHPVGARNAQAAKEPEDLIQSAYRFLLADLMPFGKNAVIRLEHGGENESTEHYQTVTYWYGAPAAALVKTDVLEVGDRASEQAHAYISPQASEPYEITSRYEWGVDSYLGGNEQPVANPEHRGEFEFEAEAGVTYYIWVRGANLDGNNLSDAFWMQFNETIGTARLGATYNHPKAFGNWLDQFPARTFAWSSALPQEPSQTVRFEREGRQRLRIQPRHAGHHVEKIWLSATQKTRPAPNAAPREGKNEIVLEASDLVGRAGAVSIVSSPVLDGAKVIELGGEAARVTVYPAHTDTARKTRGASEFTLKVEPRNLGVLLRRKLDCSFPNQRAEVFVADVPGAGAEPEWKRAGIWYLAGSNTCVYSNPREELGATQHIVQTSNRRFRDDEFLIPRGLTEGRKAIRVRVQFTPVRIPLFPGHPIPELAWSEIRYDAYCYVMPEWDPRSN